MNIKSAKFIVSNQNAKDCPKSDLPEIKNQPARYKYLEFGEKDSGKLVVFALRLDTYPKPKNNKVFYLGTNNP